MFSITYNKAPFTANTTRNPSTSIPSGREFTDTTIVDQSGLTTANESSGNELNISITKFSMTNVSSTFTGLNTITESTSTTSNGKVPTDTSTVYPPASTTDTETRDTAQKWIEYKCSKYYEVQYKQCFILDIDINRFYNSNIW